MGLGMIEELGVLNYKHLLLMPKDQLDKNLIIETYLLIISLVELYAPDLEATAGVLKPFI